MDEYDVTVSSAEQCDNCGRYILHYPCVFCGYPKIDAADCIRSINNRFGYNVIESVSRQWSPYGSDFIEFQGKIREADLPALTMGVIEPLPPVPLPRIYSNLRNEVIDHCKRHQNDCTGCDFYTDGKCNFDYNCPADF